jgi:hypothetical protein
VHGHAAYHAVIVPHLPGGNSFTCFRSKSDKDYGRYYNHFIFFGEGHLRYLIDEYVSYFNTCHPHQGVGKMPLGLADIPSEDDPPPLGKVVSDDRLGGLLRHYRRAA